MRNEDGSDERTRLLPQSTRRSPPPEEAPASYKVPRPRIRTAIYIVSFLLASLFLAAIILFILLAASFKPSSAELGALPKTSIEYTPPSHISVLDVSDAGILVNISLRCGIDADRALGVQGFYSDSDRKSAVQRGDRGTGAEWWESLRQRSAHWFMDAFGQDAVGVEVKEGLLVFAHGVDSQPLAWIDLPGKVDIPMVAGVPAYHPDHPDLSWLRPVSFVALAKPLASTGDIWDFVRKGWVKGRLDLVVGAKNVEAGLKEGNWFERWAKFAEDEVVLDISLPIPSLPGLPHPGSKLDLSALVDLKSYSLSTSKTDLTISAIATMPNFFRHFNSLSDKLDFTLPFSMPFSIALPGASSGDSKMAEVILEPIKVNQSDVVELSLKGVITGNLNSRSDNDTSPLSLFLQNYLHALPSPIHVRGLSSYPPFAPFPRRAPAWLLSTLPSLSLDLSFPGPSPPPKIIQSVTIEKMTIIEDNGRMKASGVVVAEIELPEDLAGIELRVDAVRPDVLVYDGPAPEDDSGADNDDDDDDGGEEYPAKAFGHINPPDYLPATTTPSPTVPHRFIVRAPLTNVDLDILPGRDDVLSDFVTKIVFKGGAVAGVKGVSAVRVEVEGVNGQVGVGGLPVRGEFWVGRQRG